MKRDPLVAMASHPAFPAMQASALTMKPSVPGFARRFFPRGVAALRALRAAGVATLIATAAFAGAAELTISDGVTVKFGPDAELVARDKIGIGKGTTFTSSKDTPAAGDWRGIRIEPSSAASSIIGPGSVIRYAGTGLTLRGTLAQAAIDGLLAANNSTGLRVTGSGSGSGSGSPLFTNASLINNQTGLESGGNATPEIATSEIRGNSAFGINNTSPASVVKATGNWWGAASGPNDPVGNPNGSGDTVSAGVQYGQYQNTQPLLACSLTPVNGYTTSVPTITLALSCRNAVSYRLGESTAFSGNAIPMADSTTFTLSAPGSKTLYIEYSGSSGTTLVISLAQPIEYAANLPTITLTAPAANATLTGDTVITATATDAAGGSGIGKVDFYIDGVLLKSTDTAPYAATWQIASVANGPHTIGATATSLTGQTASDTRSVTVSKQNQQGPVITNLQYAGSALTSGMTLTASGTLTAEISAGANSIATTGFTLDGTVIVGGILAGTHYSIPLDFSASANGSHILALKATDSAGGSTTTTLNVTLALPPILPAAPVITTPVAGTTVTQAQLSVTGTTTPGAQVQLYVNDTAAGSPVTANGSGSFSGTVSLGSEGSITLTADARNNAGASQKSAPVHITYAADSPTVTITSPFANAALTSEVDFTASVIGNATTGVVLAIDGNTVATLTAPPYSYRWDIAQTADGPHTLTATATNAAGKTAQDSRTVTVQKNRPPPAPIPAPYTGEVSSISPANSWGEQNIVIQGRAKDRGTGTALPGVPLKMVLQAGGFQRTIKILADDNGNYTWSFIPQTGDAGTYVVSVVHPADTAPASQGQFTINRLNFSQTVIEVNAAKNITQPVQITASASAGQGATGVYFRLNAEDQPSGSLPAGIAVDSATASIPAGGSVPVSLNFTGSASALQAGIVIATAYASESGTAKRGKITLNYRLSDPLPALYPNPTYIQTGTSQGQSVTETVSLQNRGLITATNVTLQLQNSDGSTNVPGWIYLGSINQLGNLAVGQKQTVQITAAPDASVPNAIYNFRLHVTAGNAAGGDIPVSVSVTQSGTGSVQFKLSDIYTNTLNANGQPIPGLAGATIKIQNANVYTILQSATTDATGQATIGNLATGSYTWRASAPNHTDTSGRLQIRPGVTTTQNVFLDSNLVNVEFSVTQTTIEDHYDLQLTATYKSDVPAAVVLMEPLSINLPDLQVGEEYTGEISITNYGLVRADHVVFTPPKSDAYYKIEIQGTIPDAIGAKQRITLPYKVTSLQALPGAAASLARAAAGNLKAAIAGARASNDAGGMCTGYSNAAGITYDDPCASGDIHYGSASTTFSWAAGPACNWGGGDGGSAGGRSSGGWWDSDLRTGNASPMPQPLSDQCVTPCSGPCCEPLGGQPGGSP